MHWFRSDLRLEDNTAFSAAAVRASRLATVFVFDDVLLEGPGMRGPRLRFVHGCVTSLRDALSRRGHELLVLRGDPRVVVPELARSLDVQVVTWNRDPGAYARRRDAAVAAALDSSGRRGVSFKDHVVFEASEVAPCQDRPIAVYSPYRKAWWRRHAQAPPRAPRVWSLPPGFEAWPETALPTLPLLGATIDGATIETPGEAAAQQRLTCFLENAGASYRENRDRPALDATSRLSAAIRFGTIPIRECFRRAAEAIEDDPRRRAGLEKWIDELIWREFYQAILDEDPTRAWRNHRPEFDAMEWEEDDEGFDRWSTGRTGYPFVDAGIRELRATGHMHNRLRMVVASFLTKHLLIDWRRGARFFMEWLVDGDPASNSGGWQWAASTGTDAQEVLRVFNPILQSKRFDPEGDYIRRWVPELAGLDAQAIHEPWTLPLVAAGHPAPLVEHEPARRRALERHARIARGPSDP
ncbi:MAG: deoxyribodipyrimidine photo-lyase [Myxococcota bacterium]